MTRATRILVAIATALSVAAARPDERAPAGTVTGTIEVEGARPDGAVVWLQPLGEAPPPRPGRTIVDQRRLRFVPEVVAVAPRGEVVFHNSDPLLHNIFGPGAAEPFDLGTYPEGEARSHRFATPGPHVILCNIHPEMEAWVYVTSAPHTAVVAEDGAFRLRAPAGRYRIGAWHRRGVAPEREVVVRDDAVVRIDLRLSRPASR